MRLTEYPSALKKWMIAGPEVARMVHELERNALADNQKHHEQTPAIQEEFHKDVLSVVSNFTRSETLLQTRVKTYLTSTLRT